MLIEEGVNVGDNLKWSFDGALNDNSKTAYSPVIFSQKEYNVS